MSREELIESFKGLRVSDVCDAMDMVGLMNRGCMNREIRPLFREMDRFSHHICGPALTVRYVPTNREVPNFTPEQFKQYMEEWRRDHAPGFYTKIHQGDVIVIDAAEMDVGFIGSANTFGWQKFGAVGVVTNGGARDTDELIKQNWPVYMKYISRGFKPGRLELDALNIPINCGGVLVRPGDMIVANGDGVICVPVEKAQQVAALARVELEEDKEIRRKEYERLGLALDPSVL